jgi:hypothetical protein
MAVKKKTDVISSESQTKTSPKRSSAKDKENIKLNDSAKEPEKSPEVGVEDLVGKSPEVPEENSKTEPSDDVAAKNGLNGEASDEGNPPRRVHIGGSSEGYNQPYSPRPADNQGRFSRFRNQQDFASQGPTEIVKGFLDVQPEGHGFLRPKFIQSARDIYISQSQIRRFLLRAGDLVEGLARPPKDTERYFGLLKVEKVNGIVAEESTNRPHFDDLTAIYPDKQLVLSTGKTPISTRVIARHDSFSSKGRQNNNSQGNCGRYLGKLSRCTSDGFPDR